MHGFHEYPATPLLDPTMRFRRATLEALARFKATDPWRRAPSSRTHKFNVLLKELRTIYGVRHVRATYAIRRPFGPSGASSYCPATGRIVMRGRFSVVTFLHEFAHALGKDEYGAVRWSANLFAQTFPEKMAALDAVGHTLVARPRRCATCDLGPRAHPEDNVLCGECRRRPGRPDNWHPDTEVNQ